MSALRLAIAALAIIAVVPPSMGQSAVPLQGEYELGGPLDHKGAILQGDSHLYFSISDESATAIYESLPGEPLDDACTGYQLKASGNVVCYEISPDDGHFCSFSLNLAKGTVEAGTGGCF